MVQGSGIDGKIHHEHVVDGDNNVMVVGELGLGVEDDDVRGDLIAVDNIGVKDGDNIEVEEQIQRYRCMVMKRRWGTCSHRISSR